MEYFYATLIVFGIGFINYKLAFFTRDKLEGTDLEYIPIFLIAMALIFGEIALAIIIHLVASLL